MFKNALENNLLFYERSFMARRRKKIGSEKFVHCSFMLCIILIVMFWGCKGRESYKKDLELKGIPYSETSFLNEIIVGNRKIIDTFIKAGIDINARNTNGETALMVALLYNRIDTAKMLIELGSDIHARDNEGYTALMIASFYGYHDTVKILIKEGADVHAKNNNGYTALMFASLKGHHETAELLRKAGDEK